MPWEHEWVAWDCPQVKQEEVQMAKKDKDLFSCLYKCKQKNETVFGHYYSSEHADTLTTINRYDFITC